jgi:hypothetical protein
MTTPVQREMFHHDGRGPELLRAHWNDNGTLLLAIDYYNPEDAHEEAFLKHVLVVGPQVVMVTPEEVIDYRRGGAAISGYSPAAMFDLGKSEWLRSFSARHLESCRHFQLFFYDELFDIIAEGVECRLGGFVREQGVTLLSKRTLLEVWLRYRRKSSSITTRRPTSARGGR